MSTIDLDNKYVAATYARFPVEIIGGRGAVLYCSDGKEYIDMGAGIAVNTFGMCDPEWQAAVIEQLGNFQHTSNLYYSEPCAVLAEMLCKRTGMEKVFYSNSGAEANECAIKAAREWAQRNKGRDNYTVVTLKNSFHGRTLTTLAATGQEHFHEYFAPLTPGFAYAEANNFESVREICESTGCAAIMMEMIQGEGGVNVLTKEFVGQVAEYAEKNKLLIIVDEVQTGNGRTGELYAYMNYDLVPDIVTTAKGIGGGLPIGITMLGQKVRNIFSAGMNGSTFGGNPICCAGAVSILSRLDEKMLEGVKKKAEYIEAELKNADGVASYSGMGLMIGVEPSSRSATEVAMSCLLRGVLVLTAKNKIRLLPPLNIADEALEKAVKILKEELAK